MDVDQTMNRDARRKLKGVMPAIVMILTCIITPLANAEQPPADQPKDAVKLPGVAIDLKRRHVDVQAKISLDEGLLEVVACVPDTKEHESLVLLNASPMHIHAALLMLGASNGNPYTVKRVEDEQGKERFIHLPARGDKIRVSLVYKASDGKTTERSVSDFIERSENDDGFAGPADEGRGKDQDRFPDTFLFAGSHVIQEQGGNKRYLANESGNVISISTFGDELLCLPGHQTSANTALAWQVGGKDLPKKGTAVTLRLRPVLEDQPGDKLSDKPEGKPKQQEPSPPAHGADE